MGRGRAKAKQTKVARELKYRHLDTDFTELQRELHGDSPSADGSGIAESDDDSEDDADPYSRRGGSESTAR
ncbi:MAG: DUF3073 domain-containing protein [Actinomycetota bacterium]|nr:DUF3073 domain-containing protein [Actinomycetota bacterium]